MIESQTTRDLLMAAIMIAGYGVVAVCICLMGSALQGIGADPKPEPKGRVRMRLIGRPERVVDVDVN